MVFVMHERPGKGSGLELDSNSDMYSMLFSFLLYWMASDALLHLALSRCTASELCSPHAESETDAHIARRSEASYSTMRFIASSVTISIQTTSPELYSDTP